MLKIKRLLYPTDFSGPSEHAFTAAVFLAERYGAELHALHVLALHAADPNDPDHELPGMEEVYEQLSRAADARLRAIGEAHSSDIRIHQAQERGISAATGILDYAQDHDIDLIVMGTHGRRGLRRFVMGSVAEEVVRLARCPVLTVRQTEAKKTLERFNRIIVPIDFSRYSRVALAHAVELARDYDAKLELLHVIEEVIYPDFYYPVSATETIRAQELREEAARRLATLGEEIEGLTTGVQVSIGRAAQEIVDFADEEGADLIVIATHGLTGLESALIGSVAARVIRGAHCSVLTVKPLAKSLVDAEAVAAEGAAAS